MRQAAIRFQEKQTATQYLPFIQRVAWRLARRLPCHIEVQDLVSAGVLGLADAISKYDARKQPDFEKYAEWRIKGAMLDELRAADPMTRDQRRGANGVKQAVRRLEGELGRAPEETEVAAEMGIGLDALRSLKGCAEAANVLHLEDFDAAADVDCNPESLAERAEERSRLGQAIARLPERLRGILTFYYMEELSLKEIGLRMGVTESRVCQLHGEAVKRLRAQLE
jgi:RNA polymerase sigma factor for flagellar operon FliA